MPLLLFLLLSLGCLRAENWPGVPFTTVKAYYYNHDGESAPPILKNGKLHPTTANPDGALLTPDQVRRLLQTLNSKQYASLIPGCYRPRHAFIFSNGEGKVVAHYEVCLSCSLQSGHPAGLPPLTDLSEVIELVDELKIPLGVRTKAELLDSWNGDKSRLRPYVPLAAEPERTPALSAPLQKFPDVRWKGQTIAPGDLTPWIAPDPRAYSGRYTTHDGKMDGFHLGHVELSVSGEAAAWLVNGADKIFYDAITRRMHTFWDEPLLLGDLPQCQGALFAQLRLPDGQTLHGIIWHGEFLARQENPPPPR